MALPEGVTTATVIAGVPVTHTGSPVKAFVSIEPSAYLVHAATGTPLVDFMEELDISEGTAGQFILPHTDQAGFIDASGNAYTNWYYTARVTYSTPSKAKTKAPKVKVFQLTTGQASVDLDLLPAGAPALPYIAPTATVTAFEGRTGPVTLLESDLPERLTDEALSATYATTAAVAGKLDASAAKTTYARRLGGSRTIVIGDSIDAALNGWFEYLSILSNQKVTRQRNAGIGGQTTTQFLARIQADVIAHAPDICIIGGATNDHSQGITEATTRANYQAMVDALLAAGIKPVVRNCPPTDVAGSSAPWNTVALRRNAVQRHNAWLRQWATGQGIPVLDVYTPLVDPATGGLRAAIAGDGIHPTEQGNKDMAAGIIAAGLPSLFAGSVNIGTSKGEDSNLLGYGNNGVFIGDANADGVADGWNVSGATVKSIAAAVSPAIGNVQHLEGDGTATTTIYQEDQSPATRASHVVSASGRIKINTGKVRVRFEITGGSIDLGPFALPLEGIFYAEGTAPANVTRIRLNVYSDTGTAANFDVSQMAIRDRTALAT